MKKHSNLSVFVSLAIIIPLCLVVMAFQDSSTNNQRKQPTLFDTIPTLPHEFDIDTKEVDKAMKDLDINMKNLGNSFKDIDFQKISKQVQESLSKINFDKIRAEINHSMKSIDMEKIKAEIEKSLKDIDTDKINAEIKKAVKEATASINSKEIRKALENVKKIDFDKLKEEMNNVKKDLEQNKIDIQLQLEKAKEEIKKANRKLTNIKEITNEMEKDGLINRKEGYSIEFKDRELLINGKIQPQEVTEKYRKYFNNESFKINSKEN